MKELIELLERGNFRRGKFLNQEDYLKKTSEYLLAQGNVSDGFQEALIDREKQYPTGLKTKTLSICIPHADPEFVENEMIDVTIFEEPLWFRRMDKPEERIEAQMGFMLVLKGSHTHITVLKQLSLLLQKDTLKEVKNIQSKEELIQLLSEVTIC